MSNDPYTDKVTMFIDLWNLLHGTIPQAPAQAAPPAVAPPTPAQAVAPTAPAPAPAPAVATQQPTINAADFIEAFRRMMFPTVQVPTAAYQPAAFVAPIAAAPADQAQAPAPVPAQAPVVQTQLPPFSPIQNPYDFERSELIKSGRWNSQTAKNLIIKYQGK